MTKSTWFSATKPGNDYIIAWYNNGGTGLATCLNVTNLRALKQDENPFNSTCYTSYMETLKGALSLAGDC